MTKTIGHSITIVALAALVCMAMPRSQAHASGAAISAFYTTTATTNSGKAPARVSTFAAGTAIVGYYFAYSGAAPKGTIAQVIEHGPDGLIKGIVHALRFTAGSWVNYFAAGLAFSPGTYTLALMINGKQAAQTTFSVKPGIVVPKFYATSTANLTRWENSATAPNPAPVTHFPSGTSQVAYFLGVVGLKPNVTTFHIDVLDSKGNVVLTGDNHTLRYPAGYFGAQFDKTSAFDNGTYYFQLTVGALHRAATFQIGS